MTLTTWSDVEAALARRDAEPGEGAWELVWVIDGVAITERVKVVAAHGRPWLLVSAPLLATAADPRDALAYNASIAIGALAFDRGELIVRHGVALPLDERDLDEVLEAVALEAAYVRFEIAPAAQASPFVHLTD